MMINNHKTAQITKFIRKLKEMMINNHKTAQIRSIDDFCAEIDRLAKEEFN